MEGWEHENTRVNLSIDHRNWVYKCFPPKYALQTCRILTHRVLTCSGISVVDWIEVRG